MAGRRPICAHNKSMHMNRNRRHVSEFGSSGTSPGSRLGSSSNPAVVISLKPRLLAIPAAAAYIASTNWHVEELCRAGELPYLVVGKHRVIDVLDLDAWVSKQKKQTGMLRFKPAGPQLVPALGGAR